MGKWNIGWGGFGPKKYNDAVKGFFTGSEEKNYQQSLLSPEQQKLNGQLQGAATKNGGVYNSAADYYRNLVNSNDAQDEQSFQQMQAPEMRRFNEQIVPDLAEQFSGYGGIGSSGFRNAAVGAGTDLSERLGAIRANLRQNREQLKLQGAQGLLGIGQQGLQPTVENIHRPATPGFLQTAAPALAGAALNFAAPGLGSLATAGLSALQGNKGFQPSAQGYDQQFRSTGVF